MVVKNSGLSKEASVFLEELCRQKDVRLRVADKSFYIVVPYREFRTDDSESKEFLFYAKVAETSLDRAKEYAKRLLGKSCLGHQMDGHIQGWHFNEQNVREALPSERKLCTDYTLDDKV